MASEFERFLSRFSPEDGKCWLWQGAKTGQAGYGLFNGKPAHRYMWMRCYGEIPDGMFVCHKCDVPACINPQHLFLGTPKDNTHDAMRKGRLLGRPRKDTGMDPAMSIIHRLGGAATVARILGIHRTSVYYWTKPISRGGSGGVIPAKYVEPLVKHATERKIKLKPADFAVRIET